MTHQTTADTWPPPFTLKRNIRTRRVKLKISLQRGLELIVPKRFNQKSIPDLLTQHKAWIEKHWQPIQHERTVRDAAPLPDVLTLPFLNLSWKVTYIASENNKIRLLTRPQQEIVLFGNIADKTLCKTALAAWVKKLSKIHLPQRLAHLSQHTQLDYSNVTIRNQRSRWGSCSSEKAISLSFKLLFLPPLLADHILLHELCHTKQMNHSKQFWRLLASFDPAWKEHSLATRRSEQWIPAWAQDV